MIKVESNMLVLDSAFTKEDVLAINHFVEIAKEQERERIIKLLEANLDNDIETDSMFDQNAGIQIAIALIKGEK
jgi:hypothetical protein